MFKKIITLTIIGLMMVPAAADAVSATDAQKNMQSHRTSLMNEYDTLVKQGKATETKSTTGKTIVNILGAGAGAAILGVGGAQIMKASNRANFTREQQEWMDEVGSHIRCYIGPDEVGMYSDIISTELE